MSESKRGSAGETALFLDTYAMFELFRGNPAYAAFKDVKGVLTVFNLAEFNYGLKKEMEPKAADSVTRLFAPMMVDVQVDVVEEAMTLRRENKDLSIPDAVGFVVSKKLGIPFLTGDEDFRDYEGVILIK